MLGKGFPQELEGEAESCEDRTQAHQLGLRAASSSLAVTRCFEKPSEGGNAGQVDVRAIHGKDTEGVLPQQRATKPRFISLRQMHPELAPEPDGESASCLAERFFGHASVGQVRTDGLDKSPGRLQALRHGRRFQAHIHHEPGHDFGNERTVASGRATRLACRFRHRLRREDLTKRPQTEVLKNVQCVAAGRTDTVHDKASVLNPMLGGPP